MIRPLSHPWLFNWKSGLVIGGLVTAVLFTFGMIDSSQQPEGRYVPEARDASGTEIVLLLIGAKFCMAHLQPGFPEAVEQAKLYVSGYARSRGFRFRAVGVALDPSVADGLEFLARFGEFDEISSGGHWLADPAIKYLWRDYPGRPAIPQIVVLERKADTEQRNILIQDESLRLRVLGTEEIEEWVAVGAPLDPRIPVGSL
ncbi:MAG: hypothetical protein H0U67_15480 [Gemmatimonadetes bacterium]|nr:hypothetical protein [Gemmatimonadota bacterium]MBA4158753.1 hypothetical protein [Gemmatimonadota bacterium]